MTRCTHGKYTAHCPQCAGERIAKMETEVDHALASPEVSPGDVCVTASPGQPISRTDRIEAALAKLPTPAEAMGATATQPHKSEADITEAQGSCCMEHGHGVAVDEDGCCSSCGFDAMWFTPNEEVIREQAREYVEDLNSTIAALTAERDRCIAKDVANLHAIQHALGITGDWLWHDTITMVGAIHTQRTKDAAQLAAVTAERDALLKVAEAVEAYGKTVAGTPEVDAARRRIWPALYAWKAGKR